MTEPLKNIEKTKIIKQIADLSKLLSMIPSDNTATMNQPVTQKTIELSKWLDNTRSSFLKLSLQLANSLDLNLQ